MRFLSILGPLLAFAISVQSKMLKDTSQFTGTAPPVRENHLIQSARATEAEDGLAYRPLREQQPSRVEDSEALAMWNGQKGAEEAVVRHLDGTNFKRVVLDRNNNNKRRRHLVIFYSHSCGHCQGVAPTLRQFAKSVLENPEQREQAVVGVLNCSRPLNRIYCRQVKNYPVVMLFPATASTMADGRVVPSHFADSPLEQQKHIFAELLADKWDLSKSDAQLIELDAGSYLTTVDSAQKPHEEPMRFLVAFFGGSPSTEWVEFAKTLNPWKRHVRIAFVNCAKNKALCKEMLSGDAKKLPQADFIYSSVEHGDGEPSEQNEEHIHQPTRHTHYVPFKLDRNVAAMRDELVQRLFEANYNGGYSPLYHGWNNADSLLQSDDFVDYTIEPEFELDGENPQIGNWNEFIPQRAVDFRRARARFGPSIRRTRRKRRSVDFQKTVLKLWRGVKKFSHVYILLVFEAPAQQHKGQVAAFARKLILSLRPWQSLVYVIPLRSSRRLQRDEKYARVKLYRTGETQPLLIKSFAYDEDLDAFRRIVAKTELLEDDGRTFGDPFFGQLNCNAMFSRCKALYFAAETDMLKALREAVYDEVVTKYELVEGEHRTNLLNFLQILTEFLPDANFAEALKNTQSAKKVFAGLKLFLKRNDRVSADEWKAKLEQLEKLNGNPFPVDREWRHCLAVYLKNARRFTCGLWTAFHVLTVNAYEKTGANGGAKTAVETLRAIRGWAQSFFGCEDCRHHFLEMTSRAMPIEQKVSRPEDVVLYLWRAHNRVNARLALEEQFVQEKAMQRDPLFQKQQFPPPFVCPDCQGGAEKQVLDFLVDYYKRIEPVARPAESWEREMAFSMFQQH